MESWHAKSRSGGKNSVRALRRGGQAASFVEMITRVADVTRRGYRAR